MAFKVAVIAGEVSGDLLGGDLVAALKRIVPEPIELIGVGGEALQAQGLKSLFDYSELSIMGVSQVLARLPKLLSRIRETADAVIRARPDVLVIIDSPDFTHRVARRVKKPCRPCRSSTMSAPASGPGRNTGRKRCWPMSIMCWRCCPSSRL